MLERIFLQVLNMSYTASIVILVIILARLLLKKAPKKYSYILWGVALFRLLCPFAFESALSLMPNNTEPIPVDIGFQLTPRISTGAAVIDNVVSAALPAAQPAASMNPMQVLLWIAQIVWLVGIAVLLVYSVISLLQLRRRLIGAVRLRDNIWLANGIESPFVMGVVRPRIYLPSTLTERERDYIILHEQTHIRRCDHIIKILSFAALCVHWFNPLVWTAFVLSGRDMELSCDESVMKYSGEDIKQEYSASLLSLATGRRLFAATPLAFGEGDTGGRIKNVLNFKKPSRVIVIVAVVLVAAVWGGFAVDRASTGETTRDLQYFEANGFQLGGIVGDAVGLSPVEPLAGNTYDYNFEEARYSLDPESGVIRKMSVNLYDTGLSSAFNTGLEGSNPWYTIEEVTAFFGQGKSGWHDREQRLHYVEYEQKEGRLSATVRFVYTDGESDGILHRLVWVIAESSLPYPKPIQYDPQGPLELALYVWREAGQPRYAFFADANDPVYEEDIYTRGISSLDEANREIEETISLWSYRPVYPVLHIYQMNENDFTKEEMLDIQNKINIPGGNYSTTIGGYTPPDNDLESAVSKAILEANKSDNEPGGLAVEAHTTLATVADGDTVTVYLMALYQVYGYSGGGFSELRGSHVPVAITFEKTPDGRYEMTEYWIPQDGTYYLLSIRDKFPQDVDADAINTQNYIYAHVMSCYEQAIEYGKVDTAYQIASLMEIICSSPAEASNPGAYIEAHSIEFRDLVYYGRYTLDYCFSLFEQGGQTGLEGHIMAAACRDILPILGETATEGNFNTGQDWYDAQSIRE